MKSELKFTIAIPTYNGASWIGETLQSILSQSFQNFEIIISDDCSSDNTLEVISSFKDPRIKIHSNEKNLGYGKNLRVLQKLAQGGDILFLMGQDDILLKDALQKTHDAFLLDEEIGVITRPYYWFYTDFRRPVRVVEPYNPQKDAVLSILDGPHVVKKIFESAGQLSGLAYRLKYMQTDFREETFPAHIYPFAEIAKKHKVVFLKNYTVAVRITSSQTRFKKSIYDISPTLSWITMFNSAYHGKKYEKVRRVGIEQMATNFVGLIQLKNYSTFRNLLREIFLLVKYRRRNLLDYRFWFFTLGVILIPRKLLIWLVDDYKSKILSRKLKIKIEE